MSAKTTVSSTLLAFVVAGLHWNSVQGVHGRISMCWAVQLKSALFEVGSLRRSLTAICKCNGEIQRGSLLINEIPIFGSEPKLTKGLLQLTRQGKS